jgi:hypothetical protein
MAGYSTSSCQASTSSEDQNKNPDARSNGVTIEQRGLCPTRASNAPVRSERGLICFHDWDSMVAGPLAVAWLPGMMHVVQIVSRSRIAPDFSTQMDYQAA